MANFHKNWKTFIELKELNKVFLTKGVDEAMVVSGLSQPTIRKRFKENGLPHNLPLGMPRKVRAKSTKEPKPKKSYSYYFKSIKVKATKKTYQRTKRQREWDNYYKKNNLSNGIHIICNECL